MMANAKLISNAPLLLEAVEMFHDYLVGKDSITLMTIKKLLNDCGVEIEGHVGDIDVDYTEVKGK